MKDMKPADWISMGALAVAFVSIVMSTFVGPMVAGRIASAQQQVIFRAEVYAEAIALMRARLFEIEDLAGLVQPSETDPSDEEGDATSARMLLVASKEVWQSFDTFFTQYRKMDAWRAAIALAQQNKNPNLQARAALQQAVPGLRKALDEAVDHMAKDVGTRRKPLRVTR